MLITGCGCAAARFIKNRGSLAFAAWCGVAVWQTVIRESASVSMESVVTSFESLQKVGQGSDVHVAGRLQASQPVVEVFRQVHLHCVVWTECGINPEVEIRRI